MQPMKISNQIRPDYYVPSHLSKAIKEVLIGGG